MASDMYFDSIKEYCILSNTTYIFYKSLKESLERENEKEIENTNPLGKKNIPESEINFSDIEFVFADFENVDRVFNLESNKEQFESALDADLSNVRIHTGPLAEEITRKSDTKAVTIGDDIYFGANMHAPHTEEGISLLAHELTHVVQSQEDKRFVYLEDIAEAETEAELVEKALKTFNPYNIDKGSIDKPVYSEVDERELTEKSIEKSSVENIKDKTHDDATINEKKLYELYMSDVGKKYIITEKQREEIIENTLNELKWHLEEKKIELRTEEYEEYILKFLSVFG